MADSDPRVPAEEDLWAALSEIRDPTVPQVDIVDLGLVYDLRQCGGNVSVTMTLTSDRHPSPEELRAAVRARLLEVPGVERASVKLVWDPEWTQSMMSPEARRRLGISAEASQA